jgi:hypothetical protein
MGKERKRKYACSSSQHHVPHSGEESASGSLPRSKKCGEIWYLREVRRPCGKKSEKSEKGNRAGINKLIYTESPSHGMIEGGNSGHWRSRGVHKALYYLLACCESRGKDVRGGGLNASV